MLIEWVEGCITNKRGKWMVNYDGTACGQSVHTAFVIKARVNSGKRRDFWFERHRITTDLVLTCENVAVLG